MLYEGRGGGRVVSVLAFYSDDPSLIPAELFSVKLCWKRTKINKKRPVLTHFKKIILDSFFMELSQDLLNLSIEYTLFMVQRIFFVLLCFVSNKFICDNFEGRKFFSENFFGRVR